MCIKGLNILIKILTSMSEILTFLIFQVIMWGIFFYYVNNI